MASITQITGFENVPVKNIHDPNDFDAPPVIEYAERIKARDDVQDVYIGMTLEKPDVLETLIVYAPGKPSVPDLARELPFRNLYQREAVIEPHDEFLKVLSAPVTEVASFFFSPAPVDDYTERFKQFAAGAKERQGPIAAVAGVTKEDQTHEKVTGKAALVFVGWPSVEVHHAFRDGPAFTELMPLLGSIPQGREIHHVHWRKI